MRRNIHRYFLCFQKAVMGGVPACKHYSIGKIALVGKKRKQLVILGNYRNLRTTYYLY